MCFFLMQVAENQKVESEYDSPNDFEFLAAFSLGCLQVRSREYFRAGEVSKNKAQILNSCERLNYKQTLDCASL